MGWVMVTVKRVMVTLMTQRLWSCKNSQKKITFLAPASMTIIGLERRTFVTVDSTHSGRRPRRLCVALMKTSRIFF
uniref:Uncharacterized protein n=1 Tax=Arundo donax TaxID=35708 RepID=A0A0A9EV43_ARUDO